MIQLSNVEMLCHKLNSNKVFSFDFFLDGSCEFLSNLIYILDSSSASQCDKILRNLPTLAKL